MGRGKSKILMKSLNEHRPINITMNGQLLEKVNTFKNYEFIICSDGSSSKEVKTRLWMASSAIARLKPI